MNFEKIGNIISKAFDSDYIDIKRDVSGKLDTIYSNIPCHISYNSTDNPDPNSIDINPIIQSITIHLPTWVDVANNDYIIAKKMDSKNNILIAYSGRCGNPVVSQSRKKVVMSMQGTESEEPTPVPPVIKNPSEIVINYVYNGKQISNTLVTRFEKGEMYNVEPLQIEGYEVSKCTINGIDQEGVYVDLKITDDKYIIVYEYELSVELNGFKYLVKGLYTNNEGSLKNGYHLYKKIYTDSIIKDEDKYIIICNNEVIIHEDNGIKLEIKKGVKLVLVPQNKYVIVNEVIGVENNKITFVVSQFTPTDDELNAYVAEWYNGV